MGIAGEPQTLWEVWLAAFITIGIYTFLYSDNKLYRALLNIMVGLNVGYWFIVGWKQVLGPKWWDLAWGTLHAHIPAGAAWPTRAVYWIGAVFSHISLHPWAFIYWFILGGLGTLWYFQLSHRYLWLSRIVIGMTVGMGAAVGFKGSFLLNAPQITDSFRPVLAGSPSPLWSNGAPVGASVPVDWLQSANNIIFVTTIFCVMVYFFFSFSHDKKTIRGSASIGRWLLMITFGAFFGNTIMTRMAIFLERVQFLVRDWAQKTVPVTPAIYYAYGAGAVLLIAAIYFLTRRPPAKPPVPETVEEERQPTGPGATAS